MNRGYNKPGRKIIIFFVPNFADMAAKFFPIQLSAHLCNIDGWDIQEI